MPPPKSNKAILAIDTHAVSNTNFSPDIKSFVHCDRKEERQQNIILMVTERLFMPVSQCSACGVI